MRPFGTNSAVSELGSYWLGWELLSELVGWRGLSEGETWCGFGVIFGVFRVENADFENFEWEEIRRIGMRRNLARLRWRVCSKFAIYVAAAP